MRQLYLLYAALLFSAILLIVGCNDKPYAVPVPKSVLQNDCIERSLGPNIVGQNIEFAYAMAIVPSKGTIVSAQVVASIPGAAGTYLDNNSYYTDASGVDVGIPIGNPSLTDGTTTQITFAADTNAATLRYYYAIPESARGKKVSFIFSTKSSNGESASYKMGPYTIAKMDMARNFALQSDNDCYISIKDMAVYDFAQATAKPENIDLVYLYRVIPNVDFNNALVSPADKSHLPGVTLPGAMSNGTKVMQTWNLQDRNLGQLQYGVYVDDLDFEQLDLSNAPGYAINLKSESGVWVETHDGTYRAYIFVNSVDNAGNAVISLKRYRMK